MGQAVSRITTPLQNYTESVSQLISGRRKRKRNGDSGDEQSDSSSVENTSPKKKKLLTTTQYIYQALFKEHKNSDVSVMALGNIWRLHRVYLSQSPYFYSMFNGSWKESCQDFVHIKIMDPKVTLEALDAVFGSMYSDEIEIDQKVVIPVLATATLFQLEGIIDKCAEVMIENINIDTAIDYYEASRQYGTMSVKKSAFEWLESNLLCVYSSHPKLLKNINTSLMTALVASPGLYVIQTEFSLYTMLRNWMYMKLFPNYNPENCSAEEINATSKAFFENRQDEKSFLETNEGKQFVKTLQAVRTQYLTNHHMDLKIVLADNIIPKEWLNTHILNHWSAMLKVDHRPEAGPSELDEDAFYEHCMRCGRILPEPGYQKWRWTGFNFGLDLILILDSRLLSIRRHHRNEHERLLSLQTKRQFMIKVSVSSINAKQQRTFTQTSEILSLSLEKNEEVTLMILDTKLVHPLAISVKLLVVSPTNQSFKGNLLSKDESNQIPISEIGGTNMVLESGATSPPVAGEADVPAPSSSSLAVTPARSTSPSPSSSSSSAVDFV